MKLGKRMLFGITSLAVLFSTSGMALAAEEAAAKGSSVDGTTLSVLFIAAAFAIAIGIIAPAHGQGKAVVAACEGMARNPGIAGKLMTTMILGLAMMESLAIYALVVALILLLANPFI